MEKWSWIRTAMVVMAASLFLAAGIYAATVPDELEINAPYEHTKNKIKFTHKKHSTDYKIGCGECHHDENGQPLTDLKESDEVKSCFECHNKPGELKGKKAKGLSDKEKLAYHANAMHDNCVDCHKKWNKENKSKAAPTKCTDCHPKDDK
jgi:hypothetical protein